VNAVEFHNVSRRFKLVREKHNSFQERMVNLFKPSPPTDVYWALRDVSFEVPRGTTLGLIGHNGSGKSTTLKLVTRILQPTSGQVAVNGRVSALLELGSGFHPDLSGRDNIYLNGSLLGFNRADMDRRIDDIIDFAELGPFIDSPVKHYSSGMYMRLGFSIATAVEPDILITDEVLAVGDETFQRKCMNRIHEFRKEGRTILFVSHSLDAVRNLCSQAIWLNEGRMAAAGNTQTTIDAYLRWANAKDRDRIEQDRAERAERTQADTSQPTRVYVEGLPEHPVASEQAHDAQLLTEGPVTAAQPHAEPVLPPAMGDYSRYGTGEVQIDRVEFLDGQAHPSDVFLTGEPLTIRMHYHAEEPIAEPVFGLALYSQGGLHINGPNTRFGGQPIPLVEGSGYVDYIVDELPLLAGEYVISAAVYDKTLSQAFDHHERAFVLNVQTSSIGELFGTLLIASRWQWRELSAFSSQLSAVSGQGADHMHEALPHMEQTEGAADS